MILQVLFPNSTEILQRSSSAKTSEVLLLLQNEIDIVGVIVSHVGYMTSLLQCFLLKILDFFILAGDDSFKKLMVVVSFIQLKVLAYFGHKLLELFDLLTIFKRLIGDLPHLSSQIRFLKFVLCHGYAFFIEAEEGLHKLHEEEVIITHKGRKSILGV